MGSVVALANQKGGVGKTTTAVNLACYLAATGYQTLLVDLDPQGNATSSLGVDRRRLPHTTYDLLIDGVPADAAIVSNARAGLDVIGANRDLAGAEVELGRDNLVRPHFRLRRALEPLERRYDVVLIDCPPSFGMLTLNGLVAADSVIVPVQTEYLALEGLASIFERIEDIQRSLNPSLRVIGLVMTMFDARTRLAVDVVKDVHRMNPRRMFNALIPRSIRLAEAPSHQMSIFEYDPASRGAEAYRLLGAELVERLGLSAAEPAPSEMDRKSA